MQGKHSANRRLIDSSAYQKHRLNLLTLKGRGFIPLVTMLLARLREAITDQKIPTWMLLIPGRLRDDKILREPQSTGDPQCGGFRRPASVVAIGLATRTSLRGFSTFRNWRYSRGVSRSVMKIATVRRHSSSELADWWFRVLCDGPCRRGPGGQWQVEDGHTADDRKRHRATVHLDTHRGRID